MEFMFVILVKYLKIFSKKNKWIKYWLTQSLSSFSFSFLEWVIICDLLLPSYCSWLEYVLWCVILGFFFLKSNELMALWSIGEFKIYDSNELWVLISNKFYSDKINSRVSCLILSEYLSYRLFNFWYSVSDNFFIFSYLGPSSLWLLPSVNVIPQFAFIFYFILRFFS